MSDLALYKHLKKRLRKDLSALKEEIMATAQERYDAQAVVLDKILTEVQGLKADWQTLKDQVANNTVSNESLDAVDARIQRLDEVNEDDVESGGGEEPPA